MALCDPCYDLLRSLERADIPEAQRREIEIAKDVSEVEVEDFISATAFRDWLSARHDEGSIPETLPKLPGLVHSSWESFCESLDSFCPVCWIVWRHMRESPLASYRDESHPGFYLWFSGGFELMAFCGGLELRRSTDIQGRDAVVVWFTRTTKRGFEEAVARVPVERHMGSEKTVEMVKKMLSICDEGHWDGDDGCVANRRAVTRPTIPTRLIDLHSNNSQNWSLIETEDRNDFPKYVALSHRWTTDTPRLLKSNYLEFQRDQPDKALPRSYQDVFTLCRSLHIQYVWIDSLCIFQDSSDDFLHEAATMTEVYANAFCTFSICWESPSGFLRPREPRTLTRWRIFDHDMHALEHRYVFVQDKKEWQTSIGLTPVNQRGWVLQERLLSPRVLYLGNDQLYWQCDAAEACETAPEGIQDGVYVSERKNILDHANRNHFYWQDLVVKFMGMDLTFERDRLLAISGVARSLLSPVARTPPVGSNPELDEKTTEKPLQTVGYVAGLQRAYWIQDLLWFPAINTMLPDIKKIDSGSFNRRPDNDVPSWSWAACPGPIQWTVRIYPGDTKSNERMPGPEGGPMAYLRNINFEPLGSDVYGLPKSASLEISCLLVQARHAVVEKTDDLYEGIGSPTDPTKDMCFYVNSDGFLLPLPYPRAHSDESSTLAVILEPCTDIKPTCFIVPLLHARTWTEPRITGLVVQEVTRSDSKMREFVRIGSFGKRYGFGPDEVIHALLKKLPAEGDEFEQKLRDSAQVWKDTEGTMYSKDTREKGTAKAAWTTIRLV